MNEQRPTILIVDDVAMNRELLADLLSDQYDTIEAQDGNEALLTLQERTSEIALVLLDMVMPGRDGLEVLTVMNQNGWISDIPVVMISSETMPSIIEKAYTLGVTDYISRPFDQVVVQNRVRNTILLYNKQRALSELVTSQIYENTRNNSMLVTILSHIVEFRNGESGMHVLNINLITKALVKALMKRTDKYHELEENIDIISTASSMHDIGKITIPDEILNKPGRFTPEEFNVMKHHSLNGAMILDKVTFGKNEPLLKYAYEICRWHHERWDGRGYPDGLKGDEIPIAAQIVSLADVYDALTSDRCYKKAYTHEKALEMIRNNECGAFNPLLLDSLADVADELPELLDKSKRSQNNERDFSNFVETVSGKLDQNVYSQAYKQFSYEHHKRNFFESLLNGVVFEYTFNPPIVKFTTKTARTLKLPETIIDPETSTLISQEERDFIVAQLKNRLMNQNIPDVSTYHFDGEVLIKGEKHKCTFHIQQVSSLKSDNQIEPAAIYGQIDF